MNKKPSYREYIALCILLIGSISMLTSCANQQVVAGSPLPTPAGVATLPSPTRTDGKPPVPGQLYLVTPLPGEKVRIGEITEMAPTTTSLPYSVQNERDQKGFWTLFVRDPKTQKQVQLGDDNGSAMSPATTNKYIVWEYLCASDCDKSTSLKSGIYGYDLETQQHLVIVTTPGNKVFPKVDDQWVIYLDIPGPKDNFAPLHAHSLVTGEDFAIGKRVPTGNLYGLATAFYALQGDRVAWVEVETGDPARWTIRLYNLKTREERTLNIPSILSPANLSISGDIVVWWDGFWKGYDLKQDAVFTIPIVPHEWENVPVQLANTVTVMNDRLYWALKAKDKVYYLTAPIIRDK
jgi:hypothetical protein